jgi:hypothetical protein
MKIDTFKTMDCSTAHVTNKDINELLKRDDCPVCSYPYDCGTFVYVYQMDLEGTLQMAKEYGFSAEFINIFKMARENDCRYIQLDCDGTLYNDLPTFDW